MAKKDEWANELMLPLHIFGKKVKQEDSLNNIKQIFPPKTEESQNDENIKDPVIGTAKPKTIRKPKVKANDDSAKK